jgi:hypothetical protein
VWVHTSWPAPGVLRGSSASQWLLVGSMRLWVFAKAASGRCMGVLAGVYHAHPLLAHLAPPPRAEAALQSP